MSEQLETSQAEQPDSGWTAEQRAGMRRLFKMGLMIILAVTIAGIIAAIISTQVGTLR